MTGTRKNPAAVALGRRRSPAKTEAARVNGAKGGRPPLPFGVLEDPAGTWVVVDRRTRQRRPAASFHDARRQVVALNAEVR